MAKVISFTDYMRPTCKSCVSTSNEANFGFPICVNGLSPFAGEIVTDQTVCPYHMKKEDTRIDDLMRK